LTEVFAPKTFPPSGETSLLRRVAGRYLKPRWQGLLIAALCAAGVAALTGLLAQILEPAINRLLVKREMGALLSIPLTIAALALARGGLQIVQAGLVNRIGHGIVGDVQQELVGRLLKGDLARIRSSHTGSYVSSVLFDAGLIREAATNGVINYVQHGLTVLAMFVVMFLNDWHLAIFLVIAAPVADAVMRRFSKRATKAAKGAMTETSSLSSAIMESLDGIKIVKIDNREDFEEQRIAGVIARRQRHIIKGANARAQAAPVTETLMTMITALILAYAGWRAGSGSMDVGRFAAFLLALGAASQSLRQLANLRTVMSEGTIAARRLFAALDVPSSILESEQAVELQPGSGDISFENVDFGYDAAAPVIRGVNLEARSGQTIALVGPSGGGKTSLLNLVPRFYDVTSGCVRVGASDVRELTMRSLRKNIAMVTQEPFLFDDTIAANIAYGRPDAAQADIEFAARQAAAHDFISALPQGYQTSVGEAGTRLSGGQKQRIALARAFLKNAPILLLDEATSALDTESEALVQAALDRLIKGRTTLVIAHRLSTIMNADRIYVIDQGRVCEEGTHAELMSQDGLYARLAKTQSLELTPQAVA
jgi:subfamily B ATP-binding cassette protein MsbA